MKKIIFSRGMIIRIAVTLVMIFLTFFANFIAIRMMGRHAIEVYFYNKLAVAYDIGGLPGLEGELEKIITQGKLRKELALAADFKQRLPGLKEPEVFIDRTLSESNRQIVMFKNLRSAAIVLILTVYLLNIFMLRKIR